MAEVIEGQAQSVNLHAIITTTARLAQVLAEEADMLQEMKLQRVAEMQHEKMTLTALLERQRQVLARIPGAVERMSAEQKADLKRVVDVFNSVLAENHRRLNVARTINVGVVNAIRDTMTKGSTHRYYNGGGAQQVWQPPSVSFTLNKVV